MKKLDLRVKKTYQQLLDAFLVLMSEKSFDELSVSEICDKAQVHRATFYKHFKDKNEFLNFCFDSYLSRIGFNASENHASPENIKDSFMSFIVQIFEYIKANKSVFEIICSDEFVYSLGDSFAKAVNRFIYDNTMLILPGTSESKAEIFACFYSNAFIAVLKWFATNGTDENLNEIYLFLEARVDELCATYTQQLSSK